MRAGRLRHKLRLQSPTKTRTSTGGYTETWTTVATLWGSVEPLRGREYWDNAQVQGEATHRIVVRYRGSIDPQHRVYHIEDARSFQVVSVINPGERDISLEIMAKEAV